MKIRIDFTPAQLDVIKRDVQIQLEELEEYRRKYNSNMYKLEVKSRKDLLKFLKEVEHDLYGTKI